MNGQSRPGGVDGEDKALCRESRVVCTDGPGNNHTDMLHAQIRESIVLVCPTGLQTYHALCLAPSVFKFLNIIMFILWGGVEWVGVGGGGGYWSRVG